MFLRKILNIPKYHSAILFENQKIKIIKIAEKNNNFYPIYWNEINFNLESFNEKTDLVNFFKKIQKNLKIKEIHLDQIKEFSKEELNNIIDNLKIAGFEKINLINWNFNIENLILDKNKIERTIYTFFETEEDIKFYHFENKKIYRIQEVNFSDLNDEIIQEIFKDSYHKHSFVSGYFEKHLEELQKKFHKNEIKLHIFNLWTNILSFEYKIPALFKKESHKYIKTISLATPPLKEISFVKTEEKIKKENKKEEIEKENEEIDINFILDNKKETKIISEKHSFKQILKDLFSKVIWGPKESKSFKLFKKEEKKKDKKRKLFLPKPKIRLFLPKPKIKNNTKQKKKEKIIFLPKPKLIINNKHSFKLVKIKIQEKKKDKKKRKNKKKIFLPKKIKILFLPKPKKKIFRKIWKWLNSPVWKKKDKK